MCLAIPARIVETLPDDEAVVDLGGVRKRISLALVEDCAPGDYVIVHVGYALNRLDPDEAAWMDATMFARWMVESFPSRQQVLGRLERHGPTAASRGVREVLDRIPPG